MLLACLEHAAELCPCPCNADLYTWFEYHVLEWLHELAYPNPWTHMGEYTSEFILPVLCSCLISKKIQKWFINNTPEKINHLIQKVTSDIKLSEDNRISEESYQYFLTLNINNTLRELIHIKQIFAISENFGQNLLKKIFPCLILLLTILMSTGIAKYLGPINLIYLYPLFIARMKVYPRVKKSSDKLKEISQLLKDIPQDAENMAKAKYDRCFINAKPNIKTHQKK